MQQHPRYVAGQVTLSAIPNYHLSQTKAVLYTHTSSKAQSFALLLPGLELLVGMHRAGLQKVGIANHYSLEWSSKLPSHLECFQTGTMDSRRVLDNFLHIYLHRQYMAHNSDQTCNTEGKERKSHSGMIDPLPISSELLWQHGVLSTERDLQNSYSTYGYRTVLKSSVNLQSTYKTNSIFSYVASDTLSW